MDKNCIIQNILPTGLIFVLACYIKLKGKMVPTTVSAETNESGENPPLQRLNSNLHPEDIISRKSELYCIAFKRNNMF